MLKRRLIAVLILRDGQVVQSIRFRHTNVIHYDPVHAVESFNKWAVDEIVLLNVSRSDEGADDFVRIVERISADCFVPLSAGGWITSESYADRLLRGGADKLVVNTILADRPELVTTLARRHGRQCVVASMDIKRHEGGRRTVRVDRGRHDTDIEPLPWARRAVDLGAGEVLFNSIDHDGARKGYDLPTLRELCARLPVPVIAFGGVFTWTHMLQGIEAGADAVAAANIFHYSEQATRKAKSFLAEAGVAVRREGRDLVGPPPSTVPNP
jgi:cyclase